MYIQIKTIYVYTRSKICDKHYFVADMYMQLGPRWLLLYWPCVDFFLVIIPKQYSIVLYYVNVTAIYIVFALSSV